MAWLTATELWGPEARTLGSALGSMHSMVRAPGALPGGLLMDAMWHMGRADLASLAGLPAKLTCHTCIIRSAGSIADL